MSNTKEKPFELLRRQNTGEQFSDEIVKNWYVARAFVLDRLKDIAFRPDSKEHLHVVLMGDDARMLSVARQVALSAHYLNFDEDGGDSESIHRTIMTIVTQNESIKQLLTSEEYLCNLPKYCKYVAGNNIENPDSYIDIEIHVMPERPNIEKDTVQIVFLKADVDEFFNRVLDDEENVYSIDTRKACYACRMYNIGETIDNLPAENIHDAKRYTMALNVYQYEKLKDEPEPLFKNSENKKQYQLKEILSNIFCSDCFESRANAIKRLSDGKSKDEMALWEKYNEVLSISEHARWVVEKLIMGYRPLNAEERYKDERLHTEFHSKEKIKKYRKSLKQPDNNGELVHIDVCSYCDLRRVNPDDLKYDSFLMLAIPKILERVSPNNS